MGKIFNLIKNKIEDVKTEKGLREASDLLGESDHKEDNELDVLYDKAIDLIFDWGLVHLCFKQNLELVLQMLNK